MPGPDIAIDGDLTAIRAAPDFVIALSVTEKLAPGRKKNLL
jgi:hypothetical protein